VHCVSPELLFVELPIQEQETEVIGIVEQPLSVSEKTEKDILISGESLSTAVLLMVKIVGVMVVVETDLPESMKLIPEAVLRARKTTSWLIFVNENGLMMKFDLDKGQLADLNAMLEL